jgi:hypothetical protein
VLVGRRIQVVGRDAGGRRGAAGGARSNRIVIRI